MVTFLSFKTSILRSSRSLFATYAVQVIFASLAGQVTPGTEGRALPSLGFDTPLNTYITSPFTDSSREDLKSYANPNTSLKSFRLSFGSSPDRSFNFHLR